MASTAARSTARAVSAEATAVATDAVRASRCARRSDSLRSRTPRSAAASCSATAVISASSEWSNWFIGRLATSSTATQRPSSITGVESSESNDSSSPHGA